MIKKILGGIVALFLILVVIGLVAGGDDKPKQDPAKSTAPASGTPAPTSKPASKAQTFKIGDTATIGKLKITVNGIRASAGGDFLKPKEGNVWVLVDATLENPTDKSANVSSLLMFKMADSNAYNYTVTIADGAKGQLDGELGAGRKMRGEVAFEVSKDAKGLELIFEPNVFGTGQAIFKLDK